ncbi:hypothetical protein ACFQ1S_06495 [Kibdelosporangium lantanae]|uniref:Uncharacterized protein n=1 Tax=Kibdelosporangium lantanae TaxID=1497396 RepID=A0ABW3M3T4_9PSEU
MIIGAWSGFWSCQSRMLRRQAVKSWSRLPVRRAAYVVADEHVHPDSHS